MAQCAVMLALLTYADSVFGVWSLLNKPAPAYFSSPTSSLYTYLQTSTSSSTVQRAVPNNALTNDATLLHQILTQETSLRIELERKVTGILKELEQVKKTQAEAKTEQDSLLNDLTLLRSENKQLKDDLDIMKSQLMNNSLSSPEPATCQCDFSNITKELQTFKKEIRYTSLTFLDLQRDVTNIQSAVKNVSTFMEREITNQASINTDIFVYQKNISTALKVVSKKVAFSATYPQGFTSQDGQTLVFLHILSNVGGGYNNQDGVFTAPLDGVYVFFCKITQSMNSHDMHFRFMLNGSYKTQTLVYGRSNVPYRTAANLIVMQLIRGDRVWIEMYMGGGHFFNGSRDGGDQSFSGFML